MNSTEKKLREFMKLPYTVVLKRDEEGDTIARIKELEGCVAHGQDEMEALGYLEEAKEVWLCAALKAGRTVPLPDAEDDELPSGKWLMRVPRTLHKKLAEIAELEGVSLNQFAAVCLAEAVGERHSSIGEISVSGNDPAYGVSSVNIVEFPPNRAHDSLAWDQQKPFVRAIAPKDRFTFSVEGQSSKREGKSLAS